MCLCLAAGVVGVDSLARRTLQSGRGDLLAPGRELRAVHAAGQVDHRARHHAHGVRPRRRCRRLGAR